MAMKMLDPNQAAQNWATKMGTAAPAYKLGVQNTTINPMEEAAKNAQGWVDGVQEAFQNGKFVRGLRRVSKDEWVRKCVELGAGRLAAGAQANIDKFRSFMQDFLPFLAANVAIVRAMPRVTFADRLARMTKMAELSHTFVRQPVRR